VNTRAAIDHDCVVGDYASVSPGATLGGSVDVGRQGFIGLNASVVHGRRIGDHAVVGAGAVVIEDVQARAVVVGVPARVVRERAPGDPIL
jgi:acetyltransferase-like isoleucine patch superfamily enzyme